jgi:D-methionine transport system substrate-binding protein
VLKSHLNAVSSGRRLDPVNDAILREDPKGPYANLIAERSTDRDRPWVKIPVESYQTLEIRDFIETKLKGAVLVGVAICAN